MEKKKHFKTAHILTVMRALASRQCGPCQGPILARYHMRVEFVVSSCRAARGFLGYISKFHYDQDRGPALKPAKTDVAYFLKIVIK